ncbi:S9 family peptidase [Solitalea canadensis]|uniref:Dipeptidyl aminopeptidase/acylaminoacyl peptidase n=1 Tax=Solitalea canadensis (strain ATCC 29591 / DSM 3403 / JCM 21819 / LMG 8368 / NBRC 15130 / NCIMB 12057 / USAM 9D) TaxID=929556 RepID=H8KTI4_SOLCM|nr:S9 family peptidase [Solitalea canadensis]AFD06442.1 dipeptidyl aminopeptidase/acylaminoacyl peptidase [Solitalea canadensis DSM 3403]
MKKILIAVALLVSTQVMAQTRLTPETLMKFGRVAEPRVSPDGKKVVYNVRNMDIAANKGNSDIFIVDINGQNATAIANEVGDEASAKWRPDGKKIGYLKDGQVWEMNPDGTGKVQVTDVKDGISGFGYSPKMSYIWFLADVKLDKNPAEIYPDLPKVEGARIIDGLFYRHWTAWHDYAYSHVFIANYADGKVSNIKDIMSNERFDAPLQPNGGEEQFAFSPDDKKIAYTCRKLNGTSEAVSTNSDIYVYDVTAGTTENISEFNKGYDTNPRFAPDGKKMLWLSMERDGYEADKNRILVYDIAAKTHNDVTKHFDNSVGKAEWDMDSQRIFFLAGIQATEQIMMFDPKLRSMSQVVPLTDVVADITDFDFTYVNKKPVMVAAMMNISLPTEVFTLEVGKKQLTQITQVNTQLLSTLKMGKVEKRMVKTTDGKDMLVWVILPPDFDPNKKYPVLLYCQGGPQSTVSQFFSYRWNFQLMAANDYVIVAPNRRGLPSFGQAWNEEISGDWGGQCMRDYLSAIDEVSKESYVNKDRLGAVGASFGGYSVYWLAGHHEKRFKAFISHCGVFDLESMYGTTEETWFPNFDLGGPYWKNPDSYQKFSPHKFVQNWDTPILVIHNEKDFRVPLGQGMEAFSAAQLQNIPSRFLYFPDEGHWITKPQNSILWNRIFFDWLDKYLKK